MSAVRTLIITATRSGTPATVVINRGPVGSGGEGGGAVTSVAGRTGAVTLSSGDISGLGGAAVLNVGTGAGTVAAGDHTHSGVYQPVLANYSTISGLTGYPASFTPASHTHLSAAITDATSDGLQNPEKLLKTDANGYLTLASLTLGSDQEVGLITIYGSTYLSNISASLLTASRNHALPNASGTLALTARSDGKPVEILGIACSDETTVLTTGQKVAFDMPHDFVVTRVYASLTTAPSVSALTLDIEDEGTSLLNAVLSIGTSANNAETSTFASAAASYTLSKGDLLTIDIDSVGTLNAGLKIFLEGYRP